MFVVTFVSQASHSPVGRRLLYVRVPVCVCVCAVAAVHIVGCLFIDVYSEPVVAAGQARQRRGCIIFCSGDPRDGQEVEHQDGRKEAPRAGGK